MGCLFEGVLASANPIQGLLTQTAHSLTILALRLCTQKCLALGNDTVEIGRVGMAELNAYDVLHV